RDRVVEFLPRAAQLARLEVEEGLFALDAHAHRGLLFTTIHRAQIVDIALGHGQNVMRGVAPALAGDQEFAFDFDGHGGALDLGWSLATGSTRLSFRAQRGIPYQVDGNEIPRCARDDMVEYRRRLDHRFSNSAIDSTCAVCGNMSMTPALRSFQPRSLTR